MRESLPPQADVLAAPIATSLEGLAQKQVDKLVASEQFRQLWEGSNRRLHATLIAVLSGSSERVVLEDGRVTLDLNEVVDNAVGGLGRVGDALQRLGLGNVDAQFALFESAQLAQAQQLYAFLDTAAPVLLVLTLLLLVGGVVVSDRRPRAAVIAGLGLASGMVVVAIVISLSREAYLTAAAGTVLPVDAAAAFFDILSRGLRSAIRAVFVLGLVLAIGGAVSSEASWAVRLRRAVSGGLAGVGSEWDFGPFGTWVARNKGALRVVGIVIAGVVLAFQTPLASSEIMWAGIGVLVWVLLVEFFGREQRGPAVSPRTRRARQAHAEVIRRTRHGRGPQSRSVPARRSGMLLTRGSRGRVPSDVP